MNTRRAHRNRNDGRPAASARLPYAAPIEYPAALPITERREELLELIRGHQVVIVAGETGSGKSTQIPKLCLELGRGTTGRIGHTQPRRVAARTIAERVAEELGSELGSTVGYAVRFTDKVGEQTMVKVMTDGILLAEIQRDRMLRGYDTLIIDEAHERSLNVDFLLGYVKQLLPRRPDLKVIITSATIDTERFSEHFENAPVITVEGRTFPVDIRYRPYGEEPDDERDQVQAVIDALDELNDEGNGDVLVFLSGEREIHDTADALRRHTRSDGRPAYPDVLPLYARLSAAEQHRIFEPHRGRRVVLSTNVAETSLTVPGVRYVVDAGTARISRYSHRLKVQRLPIEAVSQASANQRAGRCGRVAAGICIRLYAEDDFADRPEFTEPEILRTNLASVILQMTAIGLGDIGAFPFIEPPESRSIRDGIALLEELGALELDAPVDHPRLTPLGRRLARLPLDPRFGRMVLEADQLGCVREVMIVAAALSIQDPRERPADKRGSADELHARFEESGSDFLAFVALWDYLRAKQNELSGNQFRKLCRTEYLNYVRVREWQDLYSQLKQVIGGLDIHLGTSSGHPDRVHQALLSGLLSHIGMRDGETKEYKGARNSRFVVPAGSALGKRLPRWVMVAELVETARLFGRVGAAVQPEWAERVAPHLVSYNYGEPRWDARSGRAVTTEKAMLYGLPIVAGRTIGVERVNPPVARELFIRHALVERDWQSPHQFLAVNQRTIEELQALEDRARRRDVLVGGEAVFAFYDRRIPADVTSGKRFDQWWKQTRATKPALLTLTAELLIAEGAGLPRADDYPGTWYQDDLEFAVTYTFEPGSPDDGASVNIPVAVLNQVVDAGFDWHVPGYRGDIIAALIRTLPKPVRRQLVPAAEYAEQALARLIPGSDTLVNALAPVLTELSGHVVRASDLDVGALAEHLMMTFAVLDDRGRVIARSKGLAPLRQQLSGHTRAAIARAVGPSIEQSGLTDWTIGDLATMIEIERGGNVARGYPTLVDDRDSVSVRIVTNEGLQSRAMWAGVRRLLTLSMVSPRRQLESKASNELRFAVMRLGLETAELIDDSILVAVDELMTEHGAPVWNEADYLRLREAVRGDVSDRAVEVFRTASAAVTTAAVVSKALDAAIAPKLRYSVDDMRAHLNRLVRPGFVRVAGAGHLRDIERYVRGIERRLSKLGDSLRDQQWMAGVCGIEKQYLKTLGRYPRGAVPHEAVELGWLLEEYRVSVFAQTLGTRQSVSTTKIQRELQRLA